MFRHPRIPLTKVKRNGELRYFASGTFTSLTQATYLDSFLLTQTVNLPTIEFSNTGTSDSSDAYLKWKGISRLDCSTR